MARTRTTETDDSRDLWALRNADAATIIARLQQQRLHMLDTVQPARALRFERGQLVLAGQAREATITADGVTPAGGDLLLDPTHHALGQIADRLRIPRDYLRRIHRDAPDLFDANVNGWLAGNPLEERDPWDARWSVRAFTPGDDGTPGIMRALMGDRMMRIDNLDVMVAAVEGVNASGAPATIDRADLSDSRMFVRFSCPAVTVDAPEILEGYRSPFTGQTGADIPQVAAGFVIRNSEVGDGSFSIAPWVKFLVCQNGMTIVKESKRRKHVGTKHAEDGEIIWNAEVQAKTLALITAQTKAAVQEYCTEVYLTDLMARLSGQAQVELDDPSAAIQQVAQTLTYSEDEAALILRMFTAGGQVTAGGVMQAVTAAAQHESLSPARAAYLEDTAVEALAVAASE